MIETNLLAADARRVAPARLEPALDPSLLIAARSAISEALTPALVPLLADYRRAVEALQPLSHYQWFDEAARKAQNRLAEAGEVAFAAAHAELMVEAIAEFRDRAPTHGYPCSIIDRFSISFSRILTKIAAADWSGYDRPRDLLWKDFGLALQRLIPGGARVIEPEAWLPRSLLWRGGVRQFGPALRLLGAARGPYLKLHTHDLELQEFNADGWRALMLRIADLLRLRPALKGMFVGGWLYDPALPMVSPNLAFHRALTIPNGAETFFYQGDGPDSYALIKSATRRRLYTEGKYRPEQHILIWRREPLLRWADAQPS